MRGISIEFGGKMPEIEVFEELYKPNILVVGFRAEDVDLGAGPATKWSDSKDYKFEQRLTLIGIQFELRKAHASRLFKINANVVDPTAEYPESVALANCSLYGVPNYSNGYMSKGKVVWFPPDFRPRFEPDDVIRVNMAITNDDDSNGLLGSIFVRLYFKRG